MAENIISVHKNCWIISDSEFNEDIDSQWFDDQYWLNQGRLLGASSGRGSAWMVKSDNNKMMLRHYYRGGIPAKLIKDKYLWTGLNKCRSLSEYRLLSLMVNLGLPVPEPIAAQVCRIGLFYQANILIEYLPHSSTFSQVLNTDSAIEIWQRIGQTIAQFHNHGIYHADLNAHNILISNEIIHLIDFDHSKQIKIRQLWQRSNLKRLKRSINKITDNKFLELNDNKWQHLINAYDAIIK
ncbi:MAG: 3-deoxy-D-manno-octulosonic acid kinase [Marinicellaceae bacterium]